MSNNNNINADGIWLEFLDCDAECVKRTANKSDFFVTTSYNMRNINKDEVLTKDTIFSARRWGPQRNEPDEIQKFKYSCKCTKTFGSSNIGETCQFCHSKVMKREFPLSIIGWIPLPFPILTPIGTNFVSNAIGVHRSRKSVIKKGKNGEPDVKTSKKLASNWTHLLNGTGQFTINDLVNLYDNFDEIMLPYIKPDMREFFKENKHRMFTTKFPVISRRLRRFLQTKNGDVTQIKSDNLSKLYITIINGVNVSETCRTPKYEHMVAKELTKTSAAVFEYICNELIGSKDSNSKTKIIKGEIYSTKNPWSARLLIEPDNHLKTGRGDTCRISYDAFRTLHRIDLIRILTEEYKRSYIEADRLTDIDFVLDEEQKELLKEILYSHEFWMTLNRPPSIDFSAILAVEIKDLVEEDILYVNPIICGLIRGDFDGDTLSCYVIPMDISHRMSAVLNPRRHSIWWDRSINSGYSVLNDQVINTVLSLSKCEEVEWL